MNCCYNPYFHKVTALTASDTAVEMTITNPTNISNLDYFELVLCVNPNTVVTGEPLPFTINVNGTAVPLLNKYALPINTNRLMPRKRYCGAFVEGATAADSYVILFNTPDCAQFAA
jgi:hypothetical protein